MQRGAFALADRVGAIRVSKHFELFVVRHQGIHQLGHTLIMHVVIRRTVNELQLALQVFRERNRRTVLVTIGVVLRQAHVAFLIYGVVKPLVGHRRDGDAGVVEVRITEERIKRHRAAAAPAPHTHAISIQIRPILQHLPYRRRLILGGEDAHLPVNTLAPGIAARRGGAAVVDAHHHVTLLRQHPVPHPAGAGPAIHGRLSGRFAVHVNEERILFRTIQLWRQHGVGVHLHAPTDIDLEKLALRLRQRLHFGTQRFVVFEHAHRLVGGQLDQLRNRRRLDARKCVNRPLGIRRDTVAMRPTLLRRRQALEPFAVEANAIEVSFGGVFR